MTLREIAWLSESVESMSMDISLSLEATFFPASDNFPELILPGVCSPWKGTAGSGMDSVLIEFWEHGFFWARLINVLLNM